MVYILETTKFDTYSAISLFSTYLERARRHLAACVCVFGGTAGGGGGGGVWASNNNRFSQVRVTIINMYVRAVFCFMPLKIIDTRQFGINWIFVFLLTGMWKYTDTVLRRYFREFSALISKLNRLYIQIAR